MSLADPAIVTCSISGAMAKRDQCRQAGLMLIRLAQVALVTSVVVSMHDHRYGRLRAHATGSRKKDD